MTRNRQRGLTLIELLLGLVIVAIVIGITLIAFAQTRGEAHSVQSMKNFDIVVGAVRKLYPNPRYASLTGPVLAKSAMVPNSMIDAGYNLVSPWGAAIDVGPSVMLGPMNSGFDVVYHQVPSDQCVDLVRYGASKMLRVSVGATVVKDMTATPPVNDPTPDISTAACSGGPYDLRFSST